MTRWCVGWHRALFTNMQLLTSLSGPLQSPVLTRAACQLLSPWTKFIFRKERNFPFEEEKFIQQKPGAKYKSKRNCFIPTQKLLESIFSSTGREAGMGSAAPYCPDFASGIFQLPAPRGNFFLQSQLLLILVDPKNGEWNPLLFIIQKPLTRFGHKASLAQSRAHGQLENIPEPFNNPWLVFKYKTKAEIRGSLQIVRLYKKTSIQLVINSHHLFSVIFMLGVPLSLQTLLLPQGA